MADKDMNKPQGGRDDRESGEPVQLDRDKQGEQPMPKHGEGQQGGAQRPDQRPEQRKPDQQRPEQQRPEPQSR